MATLYLAPTVNYKQTNLNGTITNSQTTITLASTTNLQAPGYIVVDRVDANGVIKTDGSKEVISYTGISGFDITGCTRGADGSTNQTHADLAVVETMPTVGMWAFEPPVVPSPNCPFALLPQQYTSVLGPATAQVLFSPTLTSVTRMVVFKTVLSLLTF